MDLERIHDFAWRIKKHGNMRVDGIVYASRKMLGAIRGDESLQQVINVACLPGIVGASLAMPDIHWGYGAPIGGVAAFDVDEGIVSPGIVGYDINCLAGDSPILCRHGYRIPIREFGKHGNEHVCGVDLKDHSVTHFALDAFLKKRPGKRMLIIRTASGKSLVATEDHPYYTPSGMKDAGQLRSGDCVAIYPFEGVSYERPEPRCLVSERDVRRILLKMRKDPNGWSARLIIGRLKKRGLLPLMSDHVKLPLLIKLMGMIYGDGSMNFIGARGDGIIGLFGNREDLELMRSDVRELGYSPSRVYEHFTKIVYRGEYRRYKNYGVVVNAASLVVLLSALGVPLGTKVSQCYDIPRWIKKAKRWQRRLFLSGFFSAELSRPRSKSSKKGNFFAPVLSMCKHEDYASNARLFLRSIATMARGFGVETTDTVMRRKRTSKNGKTSCYFELVFSCKPSSLISLWGKIGFDYHQEKARAACEAVHYLKLKQHVIQQRLKVVRAILRLKKQGLSYRVIHDRLGSVWVGKRSIQAIVQKGGRVGVASRIPKNFPTFSEFRVAVKKGLEHSSLLWDTVESSGFVRRPRYVYDFTVDHPDHNFIADGFVVSNCGVRLLRTDLDAADLKPKLREVVNQLFRDIPTGVGAHHKSFKLGPDDLKHVLKDGARWAISRGYGDEGDLDHIEAHGCIPGADPQAVSERAKERGRDQVGTLGSGNHFVEVQEVAEIYDEHAANVMGLFPGQVTITVHTGSRGFGHQVCEDHLEIMIAAARKYHIEIPDKQLCCAPIGSPQGQHYFAAMAAAANFAFANRQTITHWVREAFMHALRMGPADLRIEPVYDVCHNIAKFEEHMVGGVSRRLCVHRKGATRAFPAGHPEVPAVYREIGQPVLIPGDMGRYSFVLVGTQRAMEETFGSTCHGAGRLMSRHQAMRICRGRDIERELLDKGIIVRGSSRATVVEEVPEAYKDVADVVDAVVGAGISKKVAKLKPMGVIKG